MQVFFTLIMLLYSMNSFAQGCPDYPAIVANECLIKQLHNAEAALTKSYSELQSAVPINEINQIQKTATMLTKSQEAWLAFRKTYCEYKGFIEGGVGSYKVVREYQCLVQLTEQRMADLTDLRKHDYE